MLTRARHAIAIARGVQQWAVIDAQRCTAALPALRSSCLSAPATPLAVVLHRCMAQKQQFNRDKENMKKKKEKALEAKKKGGVMKDKASNVEAGTEVGVSVPAMEEKMRDYIENMRAALAQIKAGRAVPAQLDEVIVSAHGKMVPLKAIGTVSARNAQTLVVQVYDATLLKEVDKAIRLHSPTLNPQAEESAVVVTFPKVTKDVRDGLVKEVSKRAEETRGHLRTVRQQYLQQLKTLSAGGEVSKDLVADLKGQIQTSHDVLVAEVKKLQDEKDKEIMQV